MLDATENYLKTIIAKAIDEEALTRQEAMLLYKHSSTSLLMEIANFIRFRKHPEKNVSWIIDRNVNITNVCISACSFCNFHCSPKSDKAYITSIEEYRRKIDELYTIGGRQLLLQGGLHPKLGLDFYCELFQELKRLYPDLKLHALGPPEIVHLAKKEQTSYRDILKKLTEAGLDSLPGAGAEILVDKIRQKLSPAKCSAQEWLAVMAEAHKLNITTTATMMFGHIETAEDRIEHLFLLKELQANKPNNTTGFIAFIPWPFAHQNTALAKKIKNFKPVLMDEYIRTLALSRIVLSNIPNIQASWLTVGAEVAKVALHSGANDMGSIMIEENVVRAAGLNNKLDAVGMQKLIKEAGFKPFLRNQNYQKIEV